MTDQPDQEAAPEAATPDTPPGINAGSTLPAVGGVTGKGFVPGQSGNPAGRPKTKLLTDLLRAELLHPARGKSGKTKAALMMDGLVTMALTGRRKDRIAAIKLIFAYTDGLPTQPVEVGVFGVVRSIAAERGLTAAETDRALAAAQLYLEAIARGA